MPTPVFRELTSFDLPCLLRALRSDPVPNVFLLHVALRWRPHLPLSGPAFHGYFDASGKLRGAGAFGPTLLAWTPIEEATSMMAEEALRRRGTWVSLLGDTRFISPLWERLRRSVGPPADDHIEQWMTLAGDRFVPAPEMESLRPATFADMDRILPLRYAMIEEPEHRSLHPLEKDRIRRRCRESIREGLLYVVEERGVIVFTAAFSAMSPEVIQLSSVCTHPSYRRRGIATAAISTLCAMAFEQTSIVSLFVDGSNIPAIRVYNQLGFRPTSLARSIRIEP